MESEINMKKAVKNCSYPYIGRFKNGGGNIIVVLFTEKNTGICLYNNIDVNRFHLGQYDTDWFEDEFEYFNFSITLSN